MERLSSTRAGTAAEQRTALKSRCKVRLQAEGLLSIALKYGNAAMSCSQGKRRSTAGSHTVQLHRHSIDTEGISARWHRVSRLVDFIPKEHRLLHDLIGQVCTNGIPELSPRQTTLELCRTLA